MSSLLGLLMIITVSFLLNLPLGMWRVRTKRFSWRWLISLHLAIPLIYFIRNLLQFSFLTIPFLVVAALFGQIIGGRIVIINTRRILRGRKS